MKFFTSKMASLAFFVVKNKKILLLNYSRITSVYSVKENSGIFMRAFSSFTIDYIPLSFFFSHLPQFLHFAIAD
ncbi:hypothetical protein YC2023_087870 [Brassica napus]